MWWQLPDRNFHENKNSTERLGNASAQLESSGSPERGVAGPSRPIVLCGGRSSRASP